MLDNGKNIDDLFRENLLNHEEDLPNYIWDKIDNDLKKDKQDNKIMFIIIRGLAASIIILISFGLGYLYSQKTFNNQIVSKRIIRKQNNSDKLITRNIHKAETNFEKTKSKQKPNKTKKAITKQKFVNSNTPLIANSKKAYFKKEFYEIDNIKNYYGSILVDTNIKQNDSLNIKNKISLNKDTLFIVTNSEFIKYNKSKKWSISGQVSPQFSYNQNRQNGEIAAVSEDGELYSSNAIKDEINETSEITYTAGININYNISKKLSVRTGIFYSSKKQTMNGVYLRQETINGKRRLKSTSNQPYNATINTDLKQDLKYIEIPVIIKYRLLKNKATLDIIGGFSTNFLTQNNAYVKKENTKYWEGKVNNINETYYDIRLGFGLKYDFSSMLYFNIEPTIKYEINNSIGLLSDKSTYVIAMYAGIGIRF